MSGTKLTFAIAAALFGAAVFPLLAVAASLVLVGMAAHAMLLSPAQKQTLPTVTLEDERDKIIKEKRRELGYD